MGCTEDEQCCSEVCGKNRKCISEGQVWPGVSCVSFLHLKLKAYRSVLSKWEFFIKMRAAYLLSPSFITRGRMGASKAALILIGHYNSIELIIQHADPRFMDKKGLQRWKIVKCAPQLPKLSFGKVFVGHVKFWCKCFIFRHKMSPCWCAARHTSSQNAFKQTPSYSTN